MNEQEKQHIEELAIDTILEAPICFDLGGKSFALYPVTFGKSLIISRLVKVLKFNASLLNIEPYAECLRLATMQRKECAELIALHTCKSKQEVFNYELRRQRTTHIAKQGAESIAKLLNIVLTADKTPQMLKVLGIDKEQQRMQRATSAKDTDNNNFSFGGASVYGSLIDTACERYKWTFDYVVWGISYANLRLLLADSIKQVYLTDEERKRCGITNNKVVDATKASEEFILNQKWD